MPCGEKGFTTIETLQASVVSSIALVGLCSLLLSTIHGDARARDISIATALAETKIEQLRGTAFASLADGADTVADAGGEWTRSWAVLPGPTAGTREVVVSIGGVPRRGPLALTTILTE
jgi:Tfp pilus assembly protein PilV